MSRIEWFLTIIAAMAFVLSCARAFFLVKASNKNSLELRIAESLGQNPIGEGLEKAAVVGIVSLIWLVVIFLT